MDRYHVRQTLGEAGPSRFEKDSFIAGILLLVAGTVVAVGRGDPGGLAWALGTFGLGVLALRAISRGVRLYRAGVTASLPESVGRVGVRVRPRRISTAATAVFALVLPAAAAIAFVILVDWAWLVVAGGLLVGSSAMHVAAARERGAEELRYARESPEAVALLWRLCMRADIPAPQLVVEPGPEANAWTTRGRIHVTTPLLSVLDASELEAVLAHEVAHLARRDAAVMDVCSAPSRVLLSFAGVLTSGLKGLVKHFADLGCFLGAAAWFVTAAVISLPPAFLLGWTSRLSVLGMSRGREFAADAAAATLTGRPSALASALMKLDGERDWLPEADLRQAQARAVLCIVGADTTRLGRLFRTHPPVAARVKRLEAIEERVQAGGRAVRLED
jgi:heat shock protein HtpX